VNALRFLADQWTTENTIVAVGYVLFVAVGFFGAPWWLSRMERQRQQVAAVRARLLAATRPQQVVWQTTVQLNDGQQMRFSTTMRMDIGDFVEAGIDGRIAPANLLGNQRIIGVVVAVEMRGWL